MLPRRADRFDIGDLSLLDDEALATFLDPADDGVPAAQLGVALRDHSELATRVANALPLAERPAFEAARLREAAAAAVRRAQRAVIGHLFWPLLYWHDPDAYLELVAGEELPAALLAGLPLDDRIVADLGAGAGRFSLVAALRASRVIAIDAIPALLTRLEQRAQARGIGNIETRRGDFRHLPLDDRSVDVGVFCSSFHSRGPHGGQRALAEAERIVRPAGTIVVIWPDSPEWLLARGYSLVTTTTDRIVRFADAAAAERICRDFYGAKAARWVRDNGVSEVPFDVLGRSPASVACIRRVR
jgi:SAM-dependent methyltransferase